MARSHSQPKGSSYELTSKTAPDQWMGAGSVRNSQMLSSQYRGGHNSPTHSTASCPHTIALSTHMHRASQNYSSGYSSDVESLHSVLTEECEGEGSDSDLSDSDFSRATAGVRGKSAGSVMMKLAKKFSKKNFPIVRDDGFIESIGEGEEQARRMRNHSNSVSDLDSLEG